MAEYSKVRAGISECRGEGAQGVVPFFGSFFLSCLLWPQHAPCVHETMLDPIVRYYCLQSEIDSSVRNVCCVCCSYFLLSPFSLSISINNDFCSTLLSTGLAEQSKFAAESGVLLLRSLFSCSASLLFRLFVSPGGVLLSPVPLGG